MGLKMEEFDHFTELLVANNVIEAEIEEVLERPGGKTLFALPAEVTILLGGFASTAVKGDPPFLALNTGVVAEEVEATPGGAPGNPIPGATAGSAMTIGRDDSTAPAQAGSQILVSAKALEVEGAEFATGEMFDSDTALGSVKLIVPLCRRPTPLIAVASAPFEEMKTDPEKSAISQHLFVIKTFLCTSGSCVITVHQRHTPHENPQQSSTDVNHDSNVRSHTESWWFYRAYGANAVPLNISMVMNG